LNFSLRGLRPLQRIWSSKADLHLKWPIIGKHFTLTVWRITTSLQRNFQELCLFSLSKQRAWPKVIRSRQSS
jgi:hypothetical protein